MHAAAIPWRSRRFRLSLILSAAFALFLLASRSVGAQAALPDSVTSQGDDVRTLYFVVFGIGAAVFILVEIMIWFVVIRYRRRRADELPPQIHGSVAAEVVWTAVPFAIVLALFIFSFIVLDDVTSGADDGDEVVQVDVRAQQWSWDFFYSEPLGVSSAALLSENPEQTVLEVDDAEPILPLLSKVLPQRIIRVDEEHMLVESIEGNTLTVRRHANGTVSQTHAAGSPIYWVFSGREFRQEARLADDLEAGTRGVPVVTVPTDVRLRFNLLSIDVLHAFYTPQFLTKLDAVPGRVNTLWVNVTEPGVYESQCAEYCGLDHARMLFTVVALEPDEFDAWFSATADANRPGEAPPPPPPDETDEDEDDQAAAGPDPVNGQELFFTNGCNVCHGNAGEGAIGPTLASTMLTLDEVISQYRNPRGAMPAFPADRVPDEDVADIYAWLQTLPLPATIVPGEGTP